MYVLENIIFIQSFLLLIVNISQASHFDSGSIACDNTAGTTVTCRWKLGWTLNSGLGPCCGRCSASFVGSLSPCSAASWSCASGCSGTVASSAPYTVTGWNTQNNWEEGENTFTYTFPGNGPYTIEYSGCCWRSLAVGGSGWSIQTTFNLGARSDTGNGNQSPQTVGLPVYRQQYGCGVITMVVPMSDSDGDTVECRAATGSECSGVCNAFPHSTINSTYPNCILTFDTSGSSVSSGDWFAVALMIEDFPTSTITVGGTTFTPTTPISSVSVQFLVYVPTISGVACNAVPVFVSPTPAASSSFFIATGGSISITIQAQDTSGSPVSTITVSGPAGGTVSPTTGVSTGTGTNRFVVWSWTPTANQTGAFQVCYQAADGYGKTTDFRCATVAIGITCPDPGFGTNSVRSPSTVQASFNYGDTVTHTCNTGFVTAASAVITRSCQLYGSFDSTSPVCIPGTCPDPGYGTDASRNPATFQAFNISISVTYTCNTGYMYSTGDATRICASTGSFNGTAYACTIITCPDPGLGTNAIRTPPTSSSFVYQDTVTYSCATGYNYASGDASRTCLLSGMFNGSVYTCSAVPCTDPGYGVNANRSVGSQSFVFKDTVTYTCDVGYVYSSGDRSRTCQASGVFNGSAYTCGPVTCPDPGYGVNANRSVGNQTFIYQDKVEYSCDYGHYHVSGNGNRTCQASGVFSGSTFTCAPVPCPDPGYPLNGNRSVGNQSFVFPDQVEYSCDVGYYHVAGDGNRTCQANSTFSGTNFTCDRVPCSDPGYGINANRSHFNQSFVYQDSVTFECLPGFLFVKGDEWRNCTYNGTFDGVNMTCVAVETSKKSDLWWPWLLVALACLLFLIILAVLIYCLCRRRARKKKEEEKKRRLTTPPIYVTPVPPKSTRSRTALSFTNTILSKVVPTAPAVLPAVKKSGDHPAPKPLPKKPPAKPLEQKPPHSEETTQDTPAHPPPAPLVKNMEAVKPPMLGGVSHIPNASNPPTLPPAGPAVNILYNSSDNLKPGSTDNRPGTSPKESNLPRESKSAVPESRDIPQINPPVRPQTQGDALRRPRTRNIIPDATPRYLLPRATPVKKLPEPEPKPKKKVKAPPKYLQPRTQFVPDGVTPDKVYVNSYPRKYTVGNWMETKKPDWEQ